MKIKKYDLSKFVDLETAVLYPTRTFHLEVQGKNVSNPDKVLETASTKTCLYSVGLNSEYLDFAKYDFRFDLPETKYWSSLTLNGYDYENTVSKFGREFDDASENLVPQVIGTGDTEKKHFFGRLANSENTIFLIKIPKQIETISNTLFDPKTVWKVEFYNSRLTSNNTLSTDRFIDYDVLSVLNPEAVIEEPVLSICFGPSWDTQIQDYTLDDVPEEFLSRYTYRLFDNNRSCLTEEKYLSFNNYVSKTDYIKSVLEEIESERILYIINTTEGEIKTIDMFSAAYPESKTKYRNQNKNVLRNDETKNYQLLIEKGNLVFDSRSFTLLGIGGNINDCPLLESKLSQLSDTLYSNSSDQGKVSIAGKTFIHPKNQEVLGENPEISPYWISKDDLKDSMFNHFYVVEDGNGKVTPDGLVYLKKGKILNLNVVADKGHTFNEISGLIKGKDYTETGNTVSITNISSITKFIFQFKEIIYSLRLYLSCDKDYPNFGESHTYNLSDLRKKNIKLWYYDYSQGDDVQYTGKEITITNTTPFKFWLDTSESLYYISDVNSYFYLEESSFILDSEDKYTILSIKDTPEKLLKDSNIISIIGSLKSKQYTVNIETIKEIQVSTRKNLIFEYGDEVEIKFSYEGEESREIKFSIIDINTGKEVLDPWIKTMNQEGIVTLRIPKRTRENLNLGIKSNYKITASI